MAVTYVLDTNAVIAMLDRNASFSFSPGDDFCVSVMTRIELLGWHRMEPGSEADVRHFLEDDEIIELTPDIADEAIALRRAHRLKTPDAVIAATAKLLGRTLVTNDGKLLAIGDVPARPLA